MTRETITKVFSIISLEHTNFIPGDSSRLKAKANLWFDILQDFTDEEVLDATKKMLGARIYGDPKVGDLKNIIDESKGLNTKIDIGLEYASRVLKIHGNYPYSIVKDTIKNEYGELGVQVYTESLAFLSQSNLIAVKAHLRDLFNSKYARKQIASKGVVMIENN